MTTDDFGDIVLVGLTLIGIKERFLKNLKTK